MRFPWNRPQRALPARPLARPRRFSLALLGLLCLGISGAVKEAAYPSEFPAGSVWQDYSLPAEEPPAGQIAEGAVFGDPLFDEAEPLAALDGGDSQAWPAEPSAPRWFSDPAARPSRRCSEWIVQVLPDGLIYRSYLAGVKEPRFAGQWAHDVNQGWIWDVSLGGRAGILRYGTDDPAHPEGWQIDIEGAGMPRLDLENQRDVVATDFRFGIPLTYGRGRYQGKFGYYHLSSHLGDEYMVRNGTFSRINFSRDVLIWGHSYFWTDNLRLYAEAGWAFATDGGTEPWEFQFGIDYSPARPTRLLGAPFWAINGHLREEFDFGGHLVVQTGWQWRGTTGHLFRIGMHYFHGMSDQWEFYDQFEDKLGMGIWYDF